MRELTGKRLEKELLRLEAMKEYERQYPGLCICGIDEAGRGPLAGPVAAGAVILPEDQTILRLNDSKKLSPEAREELYEEIREKAVSWSVAMVNAETIDEINILQAVYEAMRQAVHGLSRTPDIYLNDAVLIPDLPEEKQVKIIHGDAKSLSIAAASIMAKVTRDRLMEEYDAIYPEYGFARHKGYGTREHIDAIKKYGMCPIHRRSFLTRIISTEEQ